MPKWSPIRRSRSGALLPLVAALLVAQPCLAQESSAPGVVLLRNGNVLEGAVRRAGGYYIVKSPGASLRVSADQVETSCGSLLEAYEWRRQKRVGASADSHLELARWCLRNGLLDQAAREALDARTRDPRHPRLVTIDSAIRWALDAEVSRRSREASHEQPKHVAVKPSSASQPAPQPLMILSTDARSQFVRSIQPMLIHNCATGGCHQAGSPQRMQLQRWALEGNGDPELIRQNLTAALAEINVEDPASSTLLRRARQTHGRGGDEQSKPLATYQAALLLGWLNTVTGFQQESEEPATDPPLEDAAEATSPDDAGLQPVRKPTIQRQTDASFQPRDAFDPEIFNRQRSSLASPADSLSPSESASNAVTLQTTARQRPE